jgi:hypothetical protein
VGAEERVMVLVCFDRYSRRIEMSTGPFINRDLRHQFIANRCDLCAQRLQSEVTTGYEPCADFAPAYDRKWPEILVPVEVTDHNFVGVECTRFEPVDATRVDVQLP